MPPKNKATLATNRLKQDYIRLKTDPVPYITAEPLPSNIFEWHYILEGPDNSPYEGGYYHGKIIFPELFPFEPPSIYMITPNGRFETDTKLCLSMTDFHPESWNPAWTISTILTGLLSFMLENTPTEGSTDSSNVVKRRMATESLEFNIKNKIFCELFPEYVEEINEVLKVHHDIPPQAGTTSYPDDISDTSSQSDTFTPNDETGQASEDTETPKP